MAWHDVARSKVRFGHFVCMFVDMVRIWFPMGEPRR
jgi:hypothetical protein